MVLLLPTDDAPLADRAAALGQWCQGFLHGFGVNAGGLELSTDAKEVLQEISEGERLFTLSELLDYAPLAIGIFLGLSCLHIVEKVTNRMYDDRLLIDVQRRWFEIRGDGCAGDHVAKATNDCKNVCKLFDLAQKEIWVVLVGVPAVVFYPVVPLACPFFRC